jgi:hypothetical protein
MLNDGAYDMMQIKQFPVFLAALLIFALIVRSLMCYLVCCILLDDAKQIKYCTECFHFTPTQKVKDLTFNFNVISRAVVVTLS